MLVMVNSNTAAAEKWNEAHVVPNYRARFLNNVDWVRSYVNELYLDGILPFERLQKELPPRSNLKALELAGGRGDFSMALLKSGIAQHVHLIDLSEAAVEIAQEKADGLGYSGFSASVQDVNNFNTEEKYDLIAFSQSLHHIENLEHVIANAKAALTDNGLFYVSDYIGPTKMQWTEKQLQLMNSFLSLLPESMRSQLNLDGTPDGDVKTDIKRIPLEIFEKVDPSEAVRSGEIDKVIRNSFENVQFHSMGGAISYELFRRIAHHLVDAGEERVALVKSMLYMEHMLEKEGVLSPNFGIYLCR